MVVVAVDAGNDPILRAIAPLGLAAAHGCALVVDLDREPTPFPARRSLADLAEVGPSRDELTAPVRGVAILPGGGMDYPEAAGPIAVLAGIWPAVVVAARQDLPLPTITTRALYPGFPTLPSPDGCVWQRVPAGPRPPNGSMALPVLGRRQLCQLLAGRISRRWRWVEAWRRVWESM